MARKWYQIKQEDGFWNIYITRNPGTPAWQFTTLEQAERQVEEVNFDARALYKTLAMMKIWLLQLVEEYNGDRKEAFKCLEVALAKLAIEEGRTITITARPAEGDEEDEFEY